MIQTMFWILLLDLAVFSAVEGKIYLLTIINNFKRENKVSDNLLHDIDWQGSGHKTGLGTNFAKRKEYEHGLRTFGLTMQAWGVLRWVYAT